MTCSVTPVSSSTLRTCAGGASSVSDPSSPRRLRTAISTPMPDESRKSRLAAVERDAGGTGVDELEQRVTQLGCGRHVDLAPHDHRCAVVGLAGLELQIGHASPFVGNVRLDTIRRSSRHRGVRRARTARPRRCSASPPPAPRRSENPAAAPPGVPDRRTRWPALRVSISPSVYAHRLSPGADRRFGSRPARHQQADEGAGRLERRRVVVTDHVRRRVPGVGVADAAVVRCRSPRRTR